MCYITTHACERFLERELGYITWTIDDIKKARKYLKTFIHSYKHLNLDKKSSNTKHVLINGLIMVFTKAKEVLITLYRTSEEQIDYFLNKKVNPKPKKSEIIKTFDKVKLSKKIAKLAIKGQYPSPKLLSISITEHKKKIHITVNDPENPWNPSGIFGSIEKAQEFINEYAEFYNKLDLV